MKRGLASSLSSVKRGLARSSSSAKRGLARSSSSAKRGLARSSSSAKRALAIGVVGAAVLATLLALLHSPPASAELENSIYTSKTDRLRLVVPRGWRATDQPSYPGLLLWMMRSEPEGRIVLTSEPFTRDVYCSWPVRCQMSHDALPAKLACALGSKLATQGMHVGPVQAGPKENEDAGLPSVWFEYDDGRHFLRQALAIDADHVVSLVLSASSTEARNAHVRAFEQALRTLRPLTSEEMGALAGSSAAPAGSAATPAGSAAPKAGSAAAPAAGATAPVGSAAAAVGSAAAAGSATRPVTPAGSASTPPPAASGSAVVVAVDAGVLVDAPPASAGSAMFISAPAPRLDPIGPCPRR